MSDAVIQLLVLAGIAIFLILRLKNVLGTREGFEKPPVQPPQGAMRETVGPRRDFEVIEGGPDHDIIDYVDDGSSAAKALAAMKLVEPEFSVGEFLQGARGAYEMILMGFENGTIDDLIPFLDKHVYEGFADVIQSRQDQGLSIEATFVGIRDVSITDAKFDRDSQEGEITVRFVGELTSVVRNADGEIVEGNATEIKRQKDTWTFARAMGVDDPNWKLVATGE
ncbi:Tim44/TimA family putative adaptor protein [Anianabacter salinae]|uniref:Tim44/TimA family putative adaptor protein n=1 Tax=Anianabacter salinae TaxID=2851023 RepID=UPI00225E27F4|nr:Tim44/TimA family putative adaptor protein [Anianabacter salinae]MBV0913506.1 Tim44/TimA family putative adaptor protein [Anianabacter salinae]